MAKCETAVFVSILLVVAGLSFTQCLEFVTYVDAIESWWPPTSIAAALGVPGYAPPNDYTTINLSFWLNSGPADASLLWANALEYCSSDNPWGNTTAEIQQAWLTAFHNAGKKVLVSCFGATEFPTTEGEDPIATANAIAEFVIQNQLDGADLDYEDNTAMNEGTGVDWIINCTSQLRSQLGPNYIITHAPQAPYFMSSYPQGGYLAVNNQVGSAINWYNVQFYNQGSSEYETYQTLVVESDGWASETAILQLNANGVDLNKIVLGKPVTTAGVDNTGYVPESTLESIVSEAVANTQWRGGIMGWEYSLDLDGSWINSLAPLF